MCSPVCNAFSGVRDLLGPVISVVTQEKKNVLADVAQDGMSLEFASDELRGDKEVVMAAVAQNGRAVAFASPELQKDEEVIIAVRAHNPHAFWWE